MAAHRWTLPVQTGAAMQFTIRADGAERRDDGTHPGSHRYSYPAAYRTGTSAAVGVAFGKFLGVVLPAVSQGNWILHVGSGNIGLNTASLAAIAIITLLTFTDTRGVKLGAAVQNVFTSAKVLALLG